MELFILIGGLLLVTSTAINTAVQFALRRKKAKERKNSATVEPPPPYDSIPSKPVDEPAQASLQGKAN